MGILGLEKSKKRQPNSFKTRQIAIKPPIILLPSLLSPPHPPPPPHPPLKKRNNWQQQKVLDSRTLQRSYFVTQNWKVNKHRHTAGKTFKRSSEDFISLFSKCFGKFAARQRALAPITPRARSLSNCCWQSLWIWDLPVVSLKRSMQIYIEEFEEFEEFLEFSYLYKAGSLLYKQLYEVHTIDFDYISSSLWIEPVLLASRRWGRFARRNDVPPGETL